MGVMELGISGLIIAGIVLHLTGLPAEAGQLAAKGMSGYLKYLYDILIAIELIKLLCRHDLSSMVEVLMFAVSRGYHLWHLQLFPRQRNYRSLQPSLHKPLQLPQC